MYCQSDEDLNYSDTILVQTPSNNHLLGQQFCFPFVKSLFLAAQKQSKRSLRYFLRGEVKAHLFKIMAKEAAAEPKASVLALPLLSGCLLLLAVSCRNEAGAGEGEK